MISIISTESGSISSSKLTLKLWMPCGSVGTFSQGARYTVACLCAVVAPSDMLEQHTGDGKRGEHGGRRQTARHDFRQRLAGQRAETPLIKKPSSGNSGMSQA